MTHDLIIPPGFKRLVSRFIEIPNRWAIVKISLNFIMRHNSATPTCESCSSVAPSESNTFFFFWRQKLARCPISFHASHQRSKPNCRVEVKEALANVVLEHLEVERRESWQTDSSLWAKAGASSMVEILDKCSLNNDALCFALLPPNSST